MKHKIWTIVVIIPDKKPERSLSMSFNIDIITSFIKLKTCILEILKTFIKTNINDIEVRAFKKTHIFILYFNIDVLKTEHKALLHIDNETFCEVFKNMINERIKYYANYK